MKSSRIVGSALCLALAALLSPNPAHGQYEPGQWQVAPVFGVNVYDSGTPFQTAGMIGGTVLYNQTAIRVAVDGDGILCVPPEGCPYFHFYGNGDATADYPDGTLCGYGKGDRTG